MLGVNSMEASLKQAEKSLKNDFTDNIEVAGSGSMQDFRADHNDKSLSITLSCSTKLGGAAIAVAGMNKDDTFAMIRKVCNDF